MIGRRNNRSWARYLAVGLWVGMLVVWSGGCKSKAKEEASEAGERAEVQVIDEKEPGPLVMKGEGVAGVLIQVEQEVITTSDALSALAGPLAELGTVSRGQEFREQAAKLILQYLRNRGEEILLINEAEKGLGEDGTILAERHTEAYKQQLLRECNNSLTRLRNKLRAEGTTLEEELKDYRRKLVVRTYLRGQFANRINISRQGIVDYYKQHREQYDNPRGVELLKIQIITAKHVEEGEELLEAEERALQIAQEAWGELSKGVGFGEVARKYADVRKEQGGNWGLVNPANLIEAKEREAIERLKEGEYSEVLKNAPGYCIIGIEKIVAGGLTPLSEVQEEIRQSLWERQYNRLYNERLLELGRQAVITVSPSSMRLAVELAERRFGRGRRPGGTEIPADKR